MPSYNVSMAQGMEAMRAGDGAKLVAVLQKAKDPVRMLNVLGGVADDSRWDAMHGRALLGAADYILAQPVAHIARFLPCMAIAAAREHQYKAAAKRTAAEQILARLRPLVAQDEGAADLVARSGCHAWNNGLKKESRDLYEIVRGCALVRSNAYYKELVKKHRK